MNTLTPEAINERIAKLPQEQRAAELLKIAEEAGAKSVAAQPHVEFSEEQFRTFMEGMTAQSQKLIGEKAAEVQKKYNLNHGEAVAIVEDEVSRSSKERILKEQKYEIIGKRLATTLRRSGGTGKAGEFERAVEQEAEFLQKHYGSERAERAMSLADDTAGGALAPEVFEAEVYHNIQQTALARRYCDVKTIPRGMEIKDWPKISSDLDAEVKAEGAAGNESDIATGTFSLQPKAIVSLSGPMSIDLLEASAVNIVDHLISRASAVFAKKEDNYLFNGDGGGNWNGLLADIIAANVVTMGAGELIDDVTPDHFIDLEFALDDHYIPDPEDVTGSGSVTGEAFYWFHRMAYKALKKSKTSDGEYHFAVQEMMRDKRINGNRFRRVPYLPSAPVASTKFGLFGNLKYTWVGVRPGIMIDVATEGIVGGVNLFKTGQKALRFIEFWDYAQVDDGALAALKSGA